jgi:phage I-like protein
MTTTVIPSIAYLTNGKITVKVALNGDITTHDGKVFPFVKSRLMATVDTIIPATAHSAERIETSEVLDLSKYVARNGNVQGAKVSDKDTFTKAQRLHTSERAKAAKTLYTGESVTAESLSECLDTLTETRNTLAGELGTVNAELSVVKAQLRGVEKGTTGEPTKKRVTLADMKAQNDELMKQVLALSAKVNGVPVQEVA